MRVSILIAVSAIVLSACAGSAGSAGPNGWATGRSAERTSKPPPPTARTNRRPPPRAEATVEARRVEARRTETASGLVIPVVGIDGGDLRDSFTSSRSGGRTHHAIDIAAPTGTPIVAITDGVISRKHWNRLGGRTLYLTSADGRYDFYYAHLHSYADDIEIGTRVERGQVIGAVGSTGNARGPHLHFQVLDKRGGGRGTPVNPFDLLRTAELAAAD